jgi:purine-nucleoside phosphorylase
MNRYSYDFYRQSADYILDKAGARPETALVLGSMLGPLADEVEKPVFIDYKDVPNFPVSTVKSHAGRFVLGSLGGKKVVIMSGRFHWYEGYEFEQLAAPIRVLKLLGAKQTILTNASGAINTDYRPGDLMVIRDHIKLIGASPMRGPNVDEFGKRFFDVTRMYTPKLRQIALSCAEKLGQAETTREGIYFYYGGPNFETPAEIRAMRLLGADAVGMSTVTEALTAAHCGMDILALSLITNMAAGVLDTPISGEEIDRTAAQALTRIQALIKTVLAEL